MSELYRAVRHERNGHSLRWVAVDHPSGNAPSAGLDLGCSLPDVSRNDWVDGDMCAAGSNDVSNDLGDDLGLDLGEDLGEGVYIHTVHGPGWREEEQERLFGALRRYSRHLPESIAEAVGKSKENVSRYLARLRHLSDASRLLLDDSGSAFLARLDSENEVEEGDGASTYFDWLPMGTLGARLDSVTSARGKQSRDEGGSTSCEEEERGAREQDDVLGAEGVLNMTSARRLGKRRMETLVAEAVKEGTWDAEDVEQGDVCDAVRFENAPYDGERVQRHFTRALVHFLAPLVALSGLVSQGETRKRRKRGGTGDLHAGPHDGTGEQVVHEIHVREALWQSGLLAEVTVGVALDDRGVRPYLWMKIPAQPAPELKLCRPDRQRAVRRALLTLAGLHSGCEEAAPAAPNQGAVQAKGAAKMDAPPASVTRARCKVISLALDAPRRQEVALGSVALCSPWAGGLEVQH